MTYERIVLYSHWDGMIGPSSHTDEVVVWSCDVCAALIQDVDMELHGAWHDGIDAIAKEAKRYKPAPRYGGTI